MAARNAVARNEIIIFMFFCLADRGIPRGELEANRILAGMRRSRLIESPEDENVGRA